jgi:hypothetical protein
MLNKRLIRKIRFFKDLAGLESAMRPEVSVFGMVSSLLFGCQRSIAAKKMVAGGSFEVKGIQLRFSVQKSLTQRALGHTG